MRLTALLTLSAVAHAAVILGLYVLVPLGRWDSFDITWLDRDNALGDGKLSDQRTSNGFAAPAQSTNGSVKQPPSVPKAPTQQPATQPLPVAPDAGPPPDPHSPRESSSTDRQKRAKASARTDGGLPDNSQSVGQSALLVVINGAAVRSSPYAEDARSLLQAFFDYRLLLEGGGLDAIRDFDSVLIATPNPYRLTQTFVAVREQLDPRRVREALEAAVENSGGRLRWQPQPGVGWVGKISSPPLLRGDRRELIVDRDLVMLFDASAHSDLVAKPRPRRPRRTQRIDPRAVLQRIEGLGTPLAKHRAKKAALVLRAINIAALISLPPNMPAPNELLATVVATDPAPLRATLFFGSPSAAEQFRKQATESLMRVASSITAQLLGLGSLAARLRLRQRGAQVQLSIDLRALELRQLLQTLRATLPAPVSPPLPARRSSGHLPPSEEHENTAP